SDILVDRIVQRQLPVTCELEDQRHRERFCDAANREVIVEGDRRATLDIAKSLGRLPSPVPRDPHAGHYPRDVEFFHDPIDGVSVGGSWRGAQRRGGAVTAPPPFCTKITRLLPGVVGKVISRTGSVSANG